MVQFKDHFSKQAAQYANYRPNYPAALFDWLASLVGARHLAWDVGTGSGQAALGLARHFERVIASDAAEAQLRNAVSHPRIAYKIMPAERTELADATVDLVAVAQAIHWFDFDRFYEEVRRVSTPDGVIAAWSYGLLRITPEIDAIVQRHYTETVGPYWPPERRHVDHAYRGIPFPFAEIEAPSFDMQGEWSLDDLLGYFSTWSATQRYLQSHGRDPTELIRAPLAQAWGAQPMRTVRWPLCMRVGRVRAEGASQSK